jgi:single-strand DNA-binding protein
MYNKIMIIGNLGRDPEMRYTAQGIPVATFSVATSRPYTDGNGDKQSETTWFNIITWRQLAENCNQYLQKGRRAFIEGRLQVRNWEAKDGKKGTSIEIVADVVRFLDRAEKEPSPPDFLNETQLFNDAPSSPDDLPF